MTGPRFPLAASIVSKAELGHGCAKRGSTRLLRPEHSPTKWIPVRRRKYGKIKGLESFTIAARSCNALVAAVLKAIGVVPFEPPADVIHGRSRVELEVACRIESNDLLIAAQALARGVPVITAREAESRRIRGLTVENRLGCRWLVETTFGSALELLSSLSPGIPFAWHR
ncbi:hypothetical protein [Methylobacterium aquaticum]|uniref:hypothetical protein n=1 Tax=Methylobacterium aquaticum TaxID=270351 RepID=UPI0019340845|nr:hypothetical protein [Methylobacterium aquaticum]QRE77473.1 type II toxin-antitoxin system VapC family toxin [Methylobacterium aquaticum]